MEKRHQIRISEIKNLAKRIHEINSMDIKEIDFIDSYLKKVDINPQIIEDWKFTGLNIMDFIMTGFYKTGFDRGQEKIKVSSHEPIQQGANSGQLQQHVVMESVCTCKTPKLQTCLLTNTPFCMNCIRPVQTAP